MDPFATPDEVAALWRPLTADEETTADMLLAAASAMIRSQYPGIDGEVTAGAVDIGILRYAAAAMVKSAMIGSGSGIRQESETVGPFSRSMTYVNPSGSLYITDTMDQMIRGYRPAAASMSFANDTTQTTVGAGYVYGGWVDPSELT